MKTFAWVFLVALALGWGLSARADEATDDAYTARDICVGLAANYLNAPPGTSFSYNAGKWKVEGTAGGRATVYEGANIVGQIQNLDYKNYTACTENFMKTFDAKRKRSEINRTIAFFNAAFELNNVLYVGACLQSTAMVGLYFGDMARMATNAGNRLSGDDIAKLLVATNASLAGRLTGYVRAGTRFSLDQDVRYFRYVEGREVPYFDLATINQYNSMLISNVSDEYRPYVVLGGNAGALSRLSALYGVLLQLDHVLSARPDQMQRVAAIRQSLQCMEQPGSMLAIRLRHQLDELGLNIRVPGIDRLLRMTDEQLRNDDAITLFTANIRREIRAM